MFFNIIGDRLGFRLQIANIVKKMPTPAWPEMGDYRFFIPICGDNMPVAVRTAAFSFCWLVPAAFFIILGEGHSPRVPLLLQLSRKRDGTQLK
jgi:hypothetical protein